MFLANLMFLVLMMIKQRRRKRRHLNRSGQTTMTDSIPCPNPLVLLPFNRVELGLEVHWIPLVVVLGDQIWIHLVGLELE
jgi:hypothetical protein